MRSPTCHRRFQLVPLGIVLWATAALLATACVPNTPRSGAGPGTTGAALAQRPVQGKVPAASSGLATELTVVASEFKFSPPSVQVPAGEKVSITLENRGVVVHDLVVQGTSFMLDVGAGQTAKGEFTFNTPGTYELICSIPGHKEAGMKGTLTVVGAEPAAPPSAAASAQQPATNMPPPVAKPLPAGLKPLPAPRMAPPTFRSAPAVVPLVIEAKETVAQVAEGVATTFWTFDGSVPGPMLRVREGDTVELTLKNAADSKVTHSIDLHAVNGPGGGAGATQVPPGGSASFRFKAMNPGVYVYHCATPMIAHHIQSGMYGLIVVEPPEGLPTVNREFYVMQSDLYLQGARGEQGLRDVSIDKLLDERPDYVLFNGSVGAVTGDNALKANVGETVRIFFGVGGPNLVSSFHVIGEVFDRVHPAGASEALTNVQTTLVPAGGATMVELKVEVPGTYVLVDHSLGRLEKGAAGQLIVEGAENPDVFQVKDAGSARSGGH